MTTFETLYLYVQFLRQHYGDFFRTKVVTYVVHVCILFLKILNVLYLEFIRMNKSIHFLQ